MAKEYTGSERRSFRRLKIPLFALYQLEKGDTFTVFKAVLWNISGGGVMFETDRVISVGSKLRLEIYQPSVKYEDLIFLILTQAKVVWAHKKEGVAIETKGGKYQVGASFLRIDKKDKNRIIEYVNRIEKW